MNLAFIMPNFNILAYIHFFSFLRVLHLKREQNSDITGAFMCDGVFPILLGNENYFGKDEIIPFCVI